MNLYVTNYIRRALTEFDLPEPDIELAHSTREILEALYLANKSRDMDKVYATFEGIYLTLPDVLREHGFFSKTHQYYSPQSLYELTPPSYLYGEEIIEGGLHVLYGASGIGKSFVALDYALNIAQDHDVIYCAAEGFGGYADRLKAWHQHHEKGEGKIHLTKDIVPLLNEDEVDHFISTTVATDIHPALIVIDTLAWCLAGGDENSAKDMQRAMNNARRIQEYTGAAVLLVHHTGKSGASERGSSALRGAADMLIRLELKDDTLVLSCEKAKESEPFETRYLKLVTVPARPGRSSCVPLPATKVAASPTDKLTSHQRAILEFASLEVFKDKGVYSRKIKEEFPALPSIYNILSNLVKRGYLEQDQRGDPFRITPDGRQALQGSSQSTPTTAPPAPSSASTQNTLPGISTHPTHDESPMSDDE